MRKLFAGGVGMVAVVAAMGGAGSVAQAAPTAYPTAPYAASYGATYTQGTITFYNRAAMVDGTQHAVQESGCRQSIAKSYHGSTLLDTTYSEVSCYNRFDPIHLYVNADVVGGATTVRVSLNNVTPEGVLIKELAWDSVPRP